MPEIRDRLNCVRKDDQGWRRKLRKIDTQMSQYENAKRQHPGGDNENSLHGILPTYWEVFHTHNAYEKKQEHLPDLNYDIGIFLVGFSSLPIVLSLAEIQPTEKIYLLYSNDTKPKCYEIAKRMRAMLQGQACFDDLINHVENIVSDIQDNGNGSGYGLEVDDPSDPVKTFKLIKTVIDKGGDKRIALDLTGGKKTMIGGGFTAGAIWASKWSEAAQEFTDFCDMFYIDSLKYDADHSAPVPGYEFLSRLKNPYDVYNVQSVHQAEKLFNNHNYEAAAILLVDVIANLNEHAKNYGLETEQDDVQKKLDMADCYGLWDAFDYKTACARKEDHEDSWEYNLKHVNCAINVLEILSEVEGTETLFAEEARIIHYAVDRYQNGIRRMESDRFDDAIVRFTQVVEILCRYHVYQIAKKRGLTYYESHHFVPEQCSLDEEWSITKLIHFLFGEYRSYDHLYRIALPDECLNIDEYDGYNNSHDITNLIKPRNDFVHVKTNPGWEDMREDAENLQELAKTFLENLSSNYCCEKGLSFDELLELHKFRE